MIPKALVTLAVSAASIALAQCRTSTSSLKDDDAPSPSGLDARVAAATQHDFVSLEGAPPGGAPYVLFAHYFGVQSPDPVAGALHMINTKKHPRHLGYLKAHVQRYASLTDTSYSALIIASQAGENGASVKEISAGALYYKTGIAPPTGFTGSSLLAFDLYHSVSAAGETIIDVSEVSRVHQKIKAAATFINPANVAFLIPTSPSSQGLYFKYKVKLEQAGVPVVRSHAFHAFKEQPTAYNPVTGYGYLRRLSASELASGSYSERDVLLLAQVPIDLNPSAGIITAEPQVPHSHVIFRAVNLGIPDVYIPHATELDEVTKHVGKLIELKVEESGAYKITAAAGDPTIETKAAAFWSARSTPVALLDADVTTASYYRWRGDGAAPPTRAMVQTYGAKGINFAVIDRALAQAGIGARERFTKSFLVPFSMYERHMAVKVTAKVCEAALEKCAATPPAATVPAACDAAVAAAGTIGNLIEAVLADEARAAMRADPKVRRANLCYVGRVVRHAKLPKADKQALGEALKAAFSPKQRIRLRSSTNAEDLAGLNGAGLYESESACLGDVAGEDGAPSACRTPLEIQRAKAAIAKLALLDQNDPQVKDALAKHKKDLIERYDLEDAVRKLYASIWSERAFLTRELTGIKHRRVHMGILVHPAFTDETANGVAIATDRADGGTDVNIVAQIDDVSVTNPEHPGASAEQVLAKVAPDGAAGGVQYVGTSNLAPDGARVLSTTEAESLARELALSARALREFYGEGFPPRVDLEYILGSQREVLIKQGRPL